MLDKLKDKAIYFLGIGGIGMSALARYFKAKGYAVTGYDRTCTTLTTQLEAEGIPIHYDEDILKIPDNVGMVVYTPAVPVSNAEYQYFVANNIPIMKRAQALGMLSMGHKTVACAGTHGKTTTSTLAAHLLYHSHIGCQAFLGGISKNYDNNLLLSETSPFLVAEADEFDRSFLQLHPYIAIITSMDADHLDIYHNKEAFDQAFYDFASQVDANGFLIVKKGIAIETNTAKAHTYTYSSTQTADFHISNLILEDGLYCFDFHHPKGIIENIKLGIPGLYNVENAVAALSAAWLCGVKPEELRAGLATFQGVKRRFDIRFKQGNVIYIDDYAHHPEELNACIHSARGLFPDKKITGIFQPHLFTRTRDFAGEFAESLSKLDEVVLLPIYPARELPIEGVSSEMLLALIHGIPKHLCEKSRLTTLLQSLDTEVLLTMGAGDIDTLVKLIEETLKTKYAAQ